MKKAKKKKVKREKDVPERLRRKKGITESFIEETPILGNLPIIGGLLKKLAETDAFQERFKEVDEEIKENIRMGKRGSEVKGSISVRPIIKQPQEKPKKIRMEDLR